MILSNVFVATAIVLGAMSKSIKSYVTVIVAHGFGGFYSGLVTGIIPIYLYEISPKNLCGLIGSMNQLSIVLGILVTNIVGLPQLLGTADLWPVLIGVGAIPILAHIVLIAGAKSPKYLYIKCNDREGAERGMSIPGCKWPFFVIIIRTHFCRVDKITRHQKSRTGTIRTGAIGRGKGELIKAAWAWMVRFLGKEGIVSSTGCHSCHSVESTALWNKCCK